MKNFARLIFLIAIIYLIWYIYDSRPDYYNPERNYQDIEQEMLTQFIVAEDSSVIELPAGHFLFTKSLALDGKTAVTIRGKGIDNTVLSFKDQKEGAEGIRISNGNNIVLEDFTVEDAAGDNIKVMDTDGITFRRVKAAWTGAVDTENGAYALYPVLCKNVLIEECEAMGSSDAGIYVGQSEKVIIRNNKAYMNVAGIESENSDDVEIYGNQTYDNTGGILVFNLPGLTRYGKNIKVYDNQVYDNNRDNFGTKGAIVSNIPAGTGMLILATNNVRVYENSITDHKTLGIGIISYDLVYEMEKDIDDTPVDAYGGVRTVTADYRSDKDYDAYPGNISIYNNRYSNSHWLPNIGSDFGKIFMFKNGMKIPDVIFDGIRPGDYESKKEYYKICVDESGIKFMDLDAGNGFESLSKDISKYRCQNI